MLLPSVATALLYDIPSYAEYVAWLLAGLLLIRLGVVKLALAPWLLPAEIVWFGWYASVYGGLLFFTLYACLIAVYMTIGSTSVSALFAAGSLLVMNFTFAQADTALVWTANLGLLTLAVPILTTFDDDDYIAEAIRNGANGYLLKNVPPARIVSGIKTVHEGAVLVHPDIARKLAGMLGARPSESAVQGAAAPAAKDLSAFGLTPAEREIVRHIAAGKSNKEIAGALFLSEGP